MPEIIRPCAVVTGATGFIGGHLARHLLEQGWRVQLLARAPGRIPTALARTCPVVPGDLADAGALDEVLDGATTVFHCAANVQTWDTPAHYHESNVEGVASLLAAIARRAPHVPRLVHVSTVDVYGFPEHPASEDGAPDPGAFPYGRSKLEGEQLVRDHGRAAHIPWTVIRPCNVIGPGSPFVARIGAELAGGLMLRVDGGRAHAGLLHLSTLLEVLVWAARSESALGQVYNLRDDCDASWADFLAGLRRRIHGRGWEIDLSYAAADRLARLCVATQGRLWPQREPLLHPLLVRIFGRTCGHSIAKLRAHGGLPPGIGLDAMLDEAAAWFLAARAKGTVAR